MNISESIKKQEELLHGNYNTLKEEIEERERRRIENYKEFWKLYRGQHWSYEEEDIDTISPVFNKAFIFVNKAIAFLVGKEPTVNYPLPEVETILAPFVNLIMKNSGGIAHFTFEAVQMGSVSGDLFIKVAVDDEWKVRLIVLDSQDVSVKYSFNSYSSSIPDKAVISWKFLDGDKIKEKREEWTANEVLVYVDEQVILEESGVNILGVVPIIHIRNLPVGKEPYGMSDLDQTEPLNKILNSSLRRFKNDVEYCGDPITMVYGARIQSIEKGEGKMWGNLPFKSKVENLELKTDFPAQQRMIEYLDNAIHEVGNVPKELVVGSNKVSNTSGIALYMLNLPILELTDRKKTQYGPGFERAIELALRLLFFVDKRREAIKKSGFDDLSNSEKMFISQKPSGIIEAEQKLSELYAKDQDPYYKMKNWYEIIFKFTDYLPKDRLTELQAAREELNMKVASRKEIMKRLGKDNIPDLLAEIEEDIEFFKRSVEKPETEVTDQSEGIKTEIKDEV